MPTPITFISRTALTRIRIRFSRDAVFVPTGPSNTMGVEFESNIVLGTGFHLYLSGSKDRAKFAEGPAEPSAANRIIGHYDHELADPTAKGGCLSLGSIFCGAQALTSLAHEMRNSVCHRIDAAFGPVFLMSLRNSDFKAARP
jgi:hypothetical protein